MLALSKVIDDHLPERFCKDRVVLVQIELVDDESIVVYQVDFCLRLWEGLVTLFALLHSFNFQL